jgi:dihydrofolate reductase
MIMGGAELYRQLLPKADRIYLTEVNASVAGDTYFPAWDRASWREISRQPFAADGANQYSGSFVVLERRVPQS